MLKNISNLGDSAVYCDFGTEVNKEINSNVINYFDYLNKLIEEDDIKGITNLTPSYNKLIISFDLSITNFQKIEKILKNLKVKNKKVENSKTIKIPICCDEDCALDLIDLSKKLKISSNEILDIILNKEYFCYMTGFIAGMPFLGDLNKKVRVNRLNTPRVIVPKGSIGITEQFCNIYTFESPGGWNIIGRTPIKVFDKSNIKNPSLVKAGNKVIFYKITKKEYKNWNE